MPTVEQILAQITDNPPPFPRTWRLFTGRDIAVSVTPKVASSSIQSSGGEQTQDITAANAMAKRIAIVRDPIDRLGSAYSWFYMMREGGFKLEVDIPWVSGFESFVDMVLDGEPNEHWHPQASILSGFKFTHIFTLDQLNAKWSEHAVSPTIPHEHAVIRQTITTYRRAELVAKYAQDSQLYNAVLAQ